QWRFLYGPRCQPESLRRNFAVMAAQWRKTADSDGRVRLVSAGLRSRYIHPVDRIGPTGLSRYPRRQPRRDLPAPGIAGEPLNGSDFPREAPNPFGIDLGGDFHSR